DELATLVGAERAIEPFTIGIAALGFALLTLIMSIRTGRRIAETPYVGVGMLAATSAFALLSLAIVATAGHPAAQPAVAQGVALPPLVFAAGLAAGAVRARQRMREAGMRDAGLRDARVRDARAPSPSLMSRALDRLPFDVRIVIVQAA